MRPQISSNRCQSLQERDDIGNRIAVGCNRDGEQNDPEDNPETRVRLFRSGRSGSTSKTHRIVNCIAGLENASSIWRSRCRR